MLLNCTNTRFTRQPLRHAFYYLLNIVSLRTPASRSVPVPENLNIIGRLDFDAEWDGAWQRLPHLILDSLAEWRADLAIKFGMGLLRVPDELKCKILSYHHGDPRQFRGRPAGFYELLGGEQTVGQIVQIISNRLDAGNVVAFAQTRARPHSYRATMAESYRLSPLLLKTAVRNSLTQNILPIQPDGKNYRLPSNWTVARFVARLFAAKIRRLFSGAFFEKAWQVAQAEMVLETPDDLLVGPPDASKWQLVGRPDKYRLLADPFPHPRGGILVEALRWSDAQAEIVHLSDGFARVLCCGPGHFSYPGTVCIGDDHFLVPETAEWSSGRVYRLTGIGSEFVAALDVENGPRLVDPTLYTHNGRIYLFANDIMTGTEALRLWSSADLFSRFSEHTASPIRISPKGGRMAGAILNIGERLYRLGQDCAREYGDGVVVFEITALSPNTYNETRLGKVAFATASGPHTLNFHHGKVLFDFYNERFTPLAGVRRLRALISKRRAITLQRDDCAQGSPERRPQATQ